MWPNMSSTIRGPQTAECPSQWLTSSEWSHLHHDFCHFPLRLFSPHPPSTGLTPVTPSFYICKIKQKSQRENPSPALPRLLFLYQIPKPHLPTPEVLWFIPNLAAGIASLCWKCCIHPAVPAAELLAMPQPPLNPQDRALPNVLCTHTCQ